MLQENVQTKSQKRSRMYSGLKRILGITLGSILYGIGVALFFDPNYLAPGGVTGLSIILSKLTQIETGTLIFIINIPILLLGFLKYGALFCGQTMYSIMVITCCTNYFSRLGAFTTDLFLACIFGSVLVAVGVGIVFRSGATTGGMDIIVRILREKNPHLKTSIIYMFLDLAVVVGSAILLQKVEQALYAAVAVFVTSYVLDMVLYGKDGAKVIFIISNRWKGITTRLMEELSVGVTYLKGKGAFTGEEKQVILCVVKKQIYPKVEEIVKDVDHSSFMIISDAKDVYGEGYKSYFARKI